MDLVHTSNQSGIIDSSTLKTSDRSCPSNEPVAVPSATDDSLDEDSICSECKEVDWDSLPTIAENFEDKDTMRTIRVTEANYEQLATSSCRICRILSVVKTHSLRKTGFDVVARPLAHFPAYALPFHWTAMSKITALQVYPRGAMMWFQKEDASCLVAIRRDDEDFSSRMIRPRSIDYEWLKSLARSCEDSHECKPRSLGPVSGLKVIEVSLRTVIDAPADCRYVALSYVWGKKPGLGPALHSQGLQQPQSLIEDAMSVTMAMGYKYLWVDRYVSLYIMASTVALI